MENKPSNVCRASVIYNLTVGLKNSDLARWELARIRATNDLTEEEFRRVRDAVVFFYVLQQEDFRAR